MEQGSGSVADVERVDLAAAAGSPGLAWGVVAAVSLTTFLAAFAISSWLYGFGTFAVVAAVASYWLVSWWRARRMATATDVLEAQAARGVLRVRVRSGNSMWWVGAGTDTELVIAGGWVSLGEQCWPAASVVLGREPSFGASRPIELLTPNGPVGASVVPRGDVGVQLSTIVDRRVRPLVGRVLAAQPVT